MNWKFTLIDSSSVSTVVEPPVGWNGIGGNLTRNIIHHGINITDDFMHIIETCMLDPEAKDDWELKDPHSGEVREVVSAKELWQKIS